MRLHLYHYMSPDLPRPTVSVNVAQEMEVIEAVHGFYYDTFGWSWSLDDLRSCRARMGRRAGFAYAEQFQEASLAAEGLPA
jgi:hypothetical protein